MAVERSSPLGALARDVLRDRVGVVMGHEGPYVQLRPVGGGREWDVRPEDVRILAREEALSVEVGESNRRSRREGWQW